MPTSFPQTARRDDPNGHLVVQRMLWYLRDTFDTIMGKIAQGTATVAQGATTVTITHGLSGAVSITVVATPLVNPGGNWWITAITATQFTLNLAVAAPVGGITFAWIARGS